MIWVLNAIMKIGSYQLIPNIRMLRCKGYNQIDGLVQDCSNSIANALELLQSCAKPSKSRRSLSRDKTYLYR